LVFKECLEINAAVSIIEMAAQLPSKVKTSENKQGKQNFSKFIL
jgi:hypothetical protein